MNQQQSPPNIILSDEQKTAVDKIENWYADSTSQEFRLGGYAGTGKTTVIRTIRQAFEKDYKRVEVCAFTGKAVNVLEKKGIWSKTLHSLLYEATSLPGGGVEFHPRSTLESAPHLIIVDEASMVSTELYNDLKSHGKKMLFVGDPGQLEPVGDNPNLMKEPDYVLKTIHRQAESSPIITLATFIRTGGVLRLQENKDGLCVRPKAGFRIPDAANFDQVLCAKNKTRTDFNRKFRLFQQKPEKEVKPDDKLIILRNNGHFGVFNGMIIFVTAVLEDNADHWIVSAKDETDRSFARLPVWKFPFGNEMPKEGFEIPRYYERRPEFKTSKAPYLVYADFGYVITCHKSQGSEWGKVLVWDENMSFVWDMKRWRYTAITRAAKELTICV